MGLRGAGDGVLAEAGLRKRWVTSGKAHGGQKQSMGMGGVGHILADRGE